MKVLQRNKKRLFCCVRFMQRVTSLALILVMLPFMFAVSASADTDDSFINILDFAFTEETGTYNVPLEKGSGTATFHLPWKMTTQYVDILFSWYDTSNTFTSIRLTHPNGTVYGNLTFEKVADNIWRAFGNVTGSYTNYLRIEFNSSYAGALNLDIYAFYVSPMKMITEDIDGFCEIDNGTYENTIHYVPTDPSNQRSWTSDTDARLVLHMYTPKWYLYDYIDFTFIMSNVQEINAITVKYNDMGVPYTVTHVYPDSSTSGFYSVSVRVDLRNLNRAVDDGPVLVIQAYPASGTSFVSVYGITGIVSTDTVDPLAYWFSQVGKWFTSQTNSLTSSINGLGSNIGNWFADQTSSITGAIASGVDQIVAALTGGDQADDLKDGADQIGEAGSSLGDHIGSIHDFEDQYFGQLDTNMDSIVAAGNISGIVAPLAFVQRYANMIVSGIPSAYLVIFTLPVLLGIFMFIVGHPIKAPRPDTSGDTVTRETFTQTTILSGPGAGHTRSTRTVTTSTEIGRVHNE